MDHKQELKNDEHFQFPESMIELNIFSSPNEDILHILHRKEIISEKN